MLLEAINNNTTIVQMLDPMLALVAWLFPAVVRLFCDLFFGTSEAYSLERFWPPLGHPWSDCPNLLDELRSHFTPNVKDSRALQSNNSILRNQMAPNHVFK